MIKKTQLVVATALALSFSDFVAASSAPVLELGANVNASAQQLSTLERKLDARNKAQIVMQRQLDDLQSEVNELRGVTELHAHQLKQVLERQRELYQELDRRVSEALKTNVPKTIVAPTTTNVESSGVGYSNNLSENESYDRAVNLVLKDKRYQQAIVEFKSFNKKYPQSTYAPNAHYWLGQLLFNKGDFKQAGNEFKIVVEQYKDSSKRSDSMLKLAAVAQKMHNQAKAIALYKEVIKQYANSSSAQLAQARLDALVH
jgi:tol-pal system protein YbgF